MESVIVAVLLAGQLCQVNGDIAGWRGDDDAPGDSSAVTVTILSMTLEMMESKETGW